MRGRSTAQDELWKLSQFRWVKSRLTEMCELLQGNQEPTGATVRSGTSVRVLSASLLALARKLDQEFPLSKTPTR